MVAVVIILAVILTVSLVALALALLARRDFEGRAEFWRHEFLSQNMDLHSFAFQNHDLIQQWETTNPHVTNMKPNRKYAEWLTLCGNVIDRKQLIDVIEYGE